MGVGSSMDSDLSHDECMGVLLKKMSLPKHQLDQEFENILENLKNNNNPHCHEQCLGLETLENQ